MLRLFALLLPLAACLTPAQAHELAYEAVVEVAEKRSLVERALERLPLPQRWLIEAFHYDRRPVADIASATGLSERAVEGRLRRAREGLRREIEADRSADGEHS